MAHQGWGGGECSTSGAGNNGVYCLPLNLKRVCLNAGNVCRALTECQVGQSGLGTVNGHHLALQGGGAPSYHLTPKPHEAWLLIRRWCSHSYGASLVFVPNGCFFMGKLGSHLLDGKVQDTLIDCGVAASPAGEFAMKRAFFKNNDSVM